MEQTTFCTTKTRTITDVVPFTTKELSEVIELLKPLEIWHSQWSSKKPFIVITEYNGEGFKLFCNAASDKEPKQYTSDQLHKFLRYQGLENCYIKAY